MVTHFRKWWLFVGLAIAIVGAGCGRGPKQGDAPTAAIPPQAGADADSEPTGTGTSFAESVITETDNADQLPPPDRTLNGLSTGKLRADVQRLWNEIAFVSPAGKKIAYSAVLDTEDGSVALA